MAGTTPLERRLRIERLLTDWFRREGFAVSSTGNVEMDEDYGGASDFDISRLADEIEREIGKVLA